MNSKVSSSKLLIDIVPCGYCVCFFYYHTFITSVRECEWMICGIYRVKKLFYKYFSPGDIPILDKNQFLHRQYFRMISLLMSTIGDG